MYLLSFSQAVTPIFLGLLPWCFHTIPPPQTGFPPQLSVACALQPAARVKQFFNNSSHRTFSPFRSTTFFLNWGIELTENQCQSVCVSMGVLCTIKQVPSEKNNFSMLHPTVCPTSPGQADELFTSSDALVTSSFWLLVTSNLVVMHLLPVARKTMSPFFSDLQQSWPQKPILAACLAKLLPRT